jgi:hypothetical protein
LAKELKIPCIFNNDSFSNSVRQSLSPPPCGESAFKL